MRSFAEKLKPRIDKSDWKTYLQRMEQSYFTARGRASAKAQALLLSEAEETVFLAVHQVELGTVSQFDEQSLQITLDGKTIKQHEVQVIKVGTLKGKRANF